MTRVIGPARSRRRRWWAVGALLGTAAVFVVFFVASSGAVTGSPSTFESGDGNMTLQAASGTDWNCFQGTTGPGGSAFATLASGTPAGCTVKTGATQTWADHGTTAVGTTENQFKSGTKFDDACVVINSGNNPPKDEWTNIAEYTEAATGLNSDNGHDLFFYGASIRPVVNGNTSGNIYFSQKATGCHTVGDVLLAFNFLNGGGTPSLSSLRWVASGTCYVSQDSAPCWGNLQSINGANFDGNVNTGTIQGTDNGISGTTLAANAFAEFGINLTQALKIGNPNGSLPCFANQTWVSRSSGSSFTSNPEDVEVVNRPTCGSITVIKDTWNAAGNRTGINQQFSYSTTGGLSPASFHLNDAGGATGDVSCTDSLGVYADSTTANPCNTITYTNVPAGSSSVTEGAEPTNFAFVSLSCTVVGSGTSADTTTTPGTAAITLGFGGNVVCTYTNQQQLGAIKIVKTNGKGAPLAGAVFSITGPNSYSNSVTTGSDGTVCVGSLAFSGTGHYTVTETSAPAGYNKDPNSHNASVNAFGDCSGGGTAVEVDVDDTPLTTLEVIATSETTNHVTKSKISCVDSSNATVGTSITTFTDPADWKTLHLTPDTYTCTVIIDP